MFYKEIEVLIEDIKESFYKKKNKLRKMKILFY